LNRTWFGLECDSCYGPQNINSLIHVTYLEWQVNFLSSKLPKRVHNRFGGMRDLANVSGDIRDGSWKQVRDTGISITSGSGICVFKESGCEDRKRKQRNAGVISIFTRLDDFTRADWYKCILCGMKCVGFQAMNRPRQSNLNVKLVWVLSRCFVLISDISILVTFITTMRYQVRCRVTFLGLVCVLDFSYTFYWALVGTAMVSLAGMATPADGNVTTVAKSEVFDTTNFAAIYYKTSASRHAFLWKEHFQAQIFWRQVKTLKALK